MRLSCISACSNLVTGALSGTVGRTQKNRSEGKSVTPFSTLTYRFPTILLLLMLQGTEKISHLKQIYYHYISPSRIMVSEFSFSEEGILLFIVVINYSVCWQDCRAGAAVSSFQASAIYRLFRGFPRSVRRFMTEVSVSRASPGFSQGNESAAEGGKEGERGDGGGEREFSPTENKMRETVSLWKSIKSGHVDKLYEIYPGGPRELAPAKQILALDPSKVLVILKRIITESFVLSPVSLGHSSTADSRRRRSGKPLSSPGSWTALRNEEKHFHFSQHVRELSKNRGKGRETLINQGTSW